MMKIYSKFFALFFTTFLFSQANVNPLIPYREGKIWGFSDTLGKVVIKPYFDALVDVQYDIYSVGKASFLLEKNKKKFVVNEKNQIEVPLNHTYDSIKLKKFDISYFEVFKNGKMGLYSNIKEIIPCNFDNIDIIGNKSYKVFIGNKCGVINSRNKLVVPIKYESIYPSWSDMEGKSKYVWEAFLGKQSVKYYDEKHVSDYDNVGVIMDKSSSNAEISFYAKEAELLKIFDTVEIKEYLQIAYVSKNKKFGVFSLKDNKLLINALYDEVVFAVNNKKQLVFKVKLNDKYGFIGENNILLLPVEYDKIQYNDKIYQYEIFKNNKVGLKIFNTIYPTIEAKYLEVIGYESINIKNNWDFNLFLVKTENGLGYVGENGVEFFKN